MTTVSQQLCLVTKTSDSSHILQSNQSTTQCQSGIVFQNTVTINQFNSSTLLTSPSNTFTQLPSLDPLPPSTPINSSQNKLSSSSFSSPFSSNTKPYDFSLKFLLVGDSDVGKEEIMDRLIDESINSPYSSPNGIRCKTTTITLEGRKIKLQLWDASGQGRFCTIFRSYSRGANGILLVYDISNKWSFDGIDRWIKEIYEHAPGVPKILIGNRCHLAYKREVNEIIAEEYAIRNDMTFYEVSALCDFNVIESLTELARVALKRIGINKNWGINTVLNLQEICMRLIINYISFYQLDKLPLPSSLKNQLKSYHMSHKLRPRTSSASLHLHPKMEKIKKNKIVRPNDNLNNNNNPHSCLIS